MKGKAYLFFLSVLLVSMQSLTVSAQGSFFKLDGIFPLPNGWSGVQVSPTFFGGYPGRVRFDVGGGQIDTSGNLGGSFWLGNAGWASFGHGVSADQPRINCPGNIWNQSTQLCPVSGSAWSLNAGWIVMDKNTLGVGSGVYYNPNTGNLEGWGWNKGLGWIPFWSNLSGATLADTTPPPATTNTKPIDGTALRFVGKIAIIGNIAGSKVFPVINRYTTNNGTTVQVTDQDVGYAYTSVNHSDIFNALRKNIALITRNITPGNEPANSDFKLIDNADLIIENSNFNNPKRSYIVRGGNIIIRQNVYDSPTTNEPVALIALKNASGSGGHIIVEGGVQRIFAYMYAEGSFFSASYNQNTKAISHYAQGGVWNIPKTQLYIRGLVVSKNTIGGAQQGSSVCPVLTPDCNSTNTPSNNTQLYDWNYFRLYDTTTQNSIPTDRPDFPQSVKNATMIIEYDSRIMTNPPPGFRKVD